MKILESKEREIFEKILKLNQNQLLKVMSSYLNSKYNKVITTKEYILAFGDIPIAVVAHLDTVFPSLPKNIFYDKEKNVMWSPKGLGADDRLGIYSIIQLVNRGYKPTVILTTNEEKGGLGARVLAKTYPKAPMALKYLIEIDRSGKNDFVTYDCFNEQFNSYISSFGFEYDWGSYSDISFIAPIWDIAACNVSCGYFDEHSYSEHFYVDYLYETINKLEQMLLNAETAPYFKYIKAEKFNSTFGG